MTKPLESQGTARGTEPRHVHTKQCWDDPGPGEGSPFLVCGFARDCICADPENCTEAIQGYRCRKPSASLPASEVGKDCICADGEIALLHTPDPCCPATTHNTRAASEAISDTEAFRRLAHAMQQAPNKETQALMDAVKRLSSLGNYDKYRIIHALAAEATVAALEKALKEERDTWRSSEVEALTAENARLKRELANREYAAEAARTAQSATLDALEEQWRKAADKNKKPGHYPVAIGFDSCADDLHAARLRGAT